MQYFSPVETHEELRNKFHQRYQYNEETLDHFPMELRVLFSKAYKYMGPEKLEDMAKQQFILGVRNNEMRERLSVHRFKNLKEAIGYGHHLEIVNRAARGAASPNMRECSLRFRLKMRRKLQISRVIGLTVLLISKPIINLAVPQVEC